MSLARNDLSNRQSTPKGYGRPGRSSTWNFVSNRHLIGVGDSSCLLGQWERQTWNGPRPSSGRYLNTIRARATARASNVERPSPPAPLPGGRGGILFTSPSPLWERAGVRVFAQQLGRSPPNQSPTATRQVYAPCSHPSKGLNTVDTYPDKRSVKRGTPLTPGPSPRGERGELFSPTPSGRRRGERVLIPGSLVTRGTSPDRTGCPRSHLASNRQWQLESPPATILDVSSSRGRPQAHQRAALRHVVFFESDRSWMINNKTPNGGWDEA